MSGAATQMSVDTHLHSTTGMEVKTFDGNGEREHPFVVVTIGAPEGRVVFYLSDEDTLDALASVIGEARAKLVGAITRAKRQSELVAS